VLTKASNTDLDFTFSSVDPLVILDAKGDLISASIWSNLINHARSYRLIIKYAGFSWTVQIHFERRKIIGILPHLSVGEKIRSLPKIIKNFGKFYLPTDFFRKTI